MTEPAAPPTSHSPTARHTGKYLTFLLDGESYAIPVLKIREIIRLTRIRGVPGLPPYIRGVLNLRGKIIPVMDLGVRFGLPASVETDQTCIVVAQVRTQEDGPMAMGLIVDAVEEVVNLAEGDIEETPDFGTQISTDYLLGMAKLKGAVKMLLDLDKVVRGENTSALSALSSLPDSAPSLA